MNNNPICQSCALPFNDEHAHFMSKEPDGTECIYCTNCYKNGEFLHPDLSMDDMIDIIVPILGQSIGYEEAEKEMNSLLPNLKRWKKD